MRCYQLCLLVSLHTHALPVLEPSNGTLAAAPLVARADTHRRLSVDLMEVAKLVAADGAAGDNFGWSVAIDGDTVVVGADLDDDAGSDERGSAYVFHRSDGGVTYGQVAKLAAADAAGTWFGTSVAIDGDTVVISGWGSVYIFRTTDSGATYAQVAKLTAGDAATGDLFGWSVAIDGTTVVVGAYGNNDAGDNSGSAYVFRTTDGGAAYGQVAKLTSADAAARYDSFGWSVAIAGDTVVSGAFYKGSAYVFSPPAPTAQPTTSPQPTMSPQPTPQPTTPALESDSATRAGTLATVLVVAATALAL